MTPGIAGDSATSAPADRPTPPDVEQVVIDTMRASLSGTSAGVSRDTEVLRLVDSLGLIMVLGKIQAALNITLQPKEVIQVLSARSIADVALALSAALSARSRDGVRSGGARTSFEQNHPEVAVGG